MKTIIDALKSGSAKERLAVTADILSVLGVSIAAVVAGVFSLPQKINVANVLGAIITSLFSLAVAALALLCFLEISDWARSRFGHKPNAAHLIQLSLWLFFLALLLSAIFVWYDYVSSFRYFDTSPHTASG